MAEENVGQSNDSVTTNPIEPELTLEQLKQERDNLKKQLSSVNSESASRRKEIESLKTEMQKFEGIDVNEFKELKAKMEEQHEKDLISRDKYSELLQMKETKHKQEFDAVKQKFDALQVEYENFRRETLIDNAAMTAAREYQAHNPEVIASLVKNKAKIMEENGKTVALIPGELDPDTGQTVTVQRYVEIMSERPDFNYLFKPKMQGTGHGAAGMKPSVPEATVKFKNSAEAAEFMKKHPDEWNKMIRDGSIQSAFGR